MQATAWVAWGLASGGALGGCAADHDPCGGCEHGGSCVDAACVCAPGFTGARCEEATPCAPDPCQPGGTCAVVEGTPQCVCAPGYWGPRCASAGLALELTPAHAEPLGDVVVDVAVADAAGDPVWTGRLAASAGGAEDLAIRAMLPCRAGAAPSEHTATISLVGAFAAPVPPAAVGDYRVTHDGVAVEPLPLHLAGGPRRVPFTCVAGSTAAVQRDLPLVRPTASSSEQASFAFDGLYCSAKLLCCADADGDGACAADGAEDITLRLGPDGTRAPSMVLGFACTGWGSAAADIVMDFDPITLDCDGGGPPDVAIDHAGPGPLLCGQDANGLSGCPAITERPGFDADTVLTQVARYEGVERLGSGTYNGSWDLPVDAPEYKAYWNLAFAVRRPEITRCTLRTRATVEPRPVTSAVHDGTIPAGVVYPFIAWEVPLVACTEEQLSFEDATAPVRLVYTSPSSGPTSFAYAFGTATPVHRYCDPPCAAGELCLHGACTCAPGPDGAPCEPPAPE